MMNTTKHCDDRKLICDHPFMHAAAFLVALATQLTLRSDKEVS